MTDIKTVLTDDQIDALEWEHKDDFGRFNIYTYTAAIEAAVLAASAPAPSKELIASSVIGWDVSVDVSTGEKDAGNRIFAKVDDWQHDGNGGIVLLANDPDFNFDPAAPVDAQDAVDADLIDSLERLGRVEIIKWQCGDELTVAIHDRNRIKLGEGKDLRDAIKATLQASQSPQDQVKEK